MLQYLPDSVCKMCGRPLQEGYDDSQCSQCKNTAIYFDKSVCVFEFSGIVQAALHKLKFEGEREIAETMGKFMADKLMKQKWKIDIILSVPLYNKRLEERGYNQSYLLACEIARECSMDAADGVLERCRHTKSQVGLSRSERAHNVRDAFSVREKKRINGKSVLIVDDIMTTGATLNECSKAVRDGGAREVYCIAAACPFHLT